MMGVVKDSYFEEVIFDQSSEGWIELFNISEPEFSHVLYTNNRSNNRRIKWTLIDKCAQWMVGLFTIVQL